MSGQAGQSDEKGHVLPMAWSLHQTARLCYFIERCGNEGCRACAHVRDEIARRGNPATQSGMPSAGGTP